MKVCVIIICHVLAVLLLLWVGFHLNEKINNDYMGVITVFSLAWAIYSTFLNILYQRWQKFHLFVSRVFLIFRRTHTFWLPHFHFEVQNPDAEKLLSELWALLSSNKFGKAVKNEETANTLKISIDKLFLISFRVTNLSVELSFDQKLLVPTHLYNDYRQRLSRLAEEVRNTVKPETARYSVIVSFKEGEKNPYYGFFVNRVPAELVQNFQLSFRLSSYSDCRVEASIDRVDIEGDNFTDTFEGLSQILALRALPYGGTK
ncbi:MAG: hypothetical protein A2173_05160 [Planctomycetes bacterium RBG_13_44_8b]|nr:MAG: hypothetical protein A2173_05160 [Planctomycetes bacterium RBG_13_44_8b]